MTALMTSSHYYLRYGSYKVLVKRQVREWLSLTSEFQDIAPAGEGTL